MKQAFLVFSTVTPRRLVLNMGTAVMSLRNSLRMVEHEVTVVIQLTQFIKLRREKV